MNRPSCVWVVGQLEPWICELLLHADLDVRYAASWPDFEAAAAAPDALIVTASQQAARGFSLVIERHSALPLVLLDEEDGAPVYDAADRSLIASPTRIEAILEFLTSQLTLSRELLPSRRCRIPALVRAGEVSFVGRAVAASERGLSITLPGLRIGLDEVEVALMTSGPCVRFEARVERHLRADGETHLGLTWLGLPREDIARILRAINVDEPDPGLLPALSADPVQGHAPIESGDLPDWVERTLASLNYAGGWNDRVLMGRLQTAIQLTNPVPPAELFSSTSDLGV